MTVGEGISLAQGLRNSPAEPIRPSSVLSRVFSGTHSESSALATVAEYGSTLDHLIQLIGKHTALYYATILSTECYSVPIRLGIVHRFLLMELARPGKTTIWLRMDRRRSKRVGNLRFLGSGGSTPSFDTVSNPSLFVSLPLC